MAVGIDITAAPPAVTGITAATQGGAPAAITANGGTLQLTVVILPSGANQAVVWSIVPGTGTATVSAGGLVTAQTSGTVWAKAVSVQNSAKKDSLEITISPSNSVFAVNTENTALEIFPNPAAGMLLVRTATEHPALGFTLSDMQGQIVWRGHADRNVLINNPLTIPAAQLAIGTYILSIQGGEIFEQHKIAIVR